MVAPLALPSASASRAAASAGSSSSSASFFAPLAPRAPGVSVVISDEKLAESHSWDFNKLLNAPDKDLEATFRLGLLASIAGDEKLAQPSFQDIFTKLKDDFNNPLYLTTKGCCYYYGVITACDWGRAEDYFEKAAKLGNPTAENMLASFRFQSGDKKSGEDLLGRAVSNREPFALCSLGEIYSGSNLFSLGHFPRNEENEEKAIKLFEKAAQQGLYYGQHCLAGMFEAKGEHEKAIKLYELAISQMNGPSIDSLCRLYENLKKIDEVARVLRNGHFICRQLRESVSRGCLRRLDGYLMNHEMMDRLDQSSRFAFNYYSASSSLARFKDFFEQSQNNPLLKKQFFDLFAQDVNSPVFVKIPALQGYTQVFVKYVSEQREPSAALLLACSRVSDKGLLEMRSEAYDQMMEEQAARSLRM